MEKNIKAFSLEARVSIESSLEGNMKIAELYELYIADLGGGHTDILHGLFRTLQELETCRLASPKCPFVEGHKTGRYLVIETANGTIAFKLTNAYVVNNSIDAEFAKMTNGISLEQMKYLEKHFKGR